MDSSSKPPLDGFSPELSKRLWERGDEVVRDAHQHLIAEGDTSDHVLLIREGHVKIEFAGLLRTVDIAGPGSIVGQMAAVRGEPRSADVVSLTPVRARSVSGDAWRELLLANPSELLRQLRLAYNRLVEVNRRQSAARLSAEQQLARAIGDLRRMGLGAETADGRWRVPLMQKDLAGYTGLKRDTVIRAMAAFKSAGLVDVERGATVVRNADGLDRVGRGGSAVGA